VNAKCLAGVLATGLAVSAGMAGAQEHRAPAPDNTKVNQRDRSKAEPTADQGKNNLTDRELAQKVRKSLMDDKALSTYAHNVKVIAQGGKVTLKGPVRSDEEKQSVEQKAAEVAGASNVTNDLTGKPAKAAKNKKS
jgi:hyperosmotically inducible periplasmic protein